MSLFQKYKDRLPKQKSKEELDKHYDGLELEHGDKFAMLVAAFLTIGLPILGMLGAIYLVIWLVFLR